jgi:hypothetical protein
MKKLKSIFILVAILAIKVSFAQQVILHAGHGAHTGGDADPKLHVNPRWRECSFQLDPGLTQSEWREFTKEAGAVVNFRPLTDARPMGKRNFEVSILQWSTAIDESKDAWNDTFVHPDSTHWLVGGPRLPIIGLTARAGITERLDVGIYLTKSPGANYGFYGAQAQYNLLNNDQKKFSTSVRGSFVKMYGPEDLNLNIYSADVVASKAFVLNEKWLTLSPYAVVSTYLSASHEKSDVVNLKNERVAALQAGAGVVARIALATVAIEYNQASVNTVSMKIGATF